MLWRRLRGPILPGRQDGHNPPPPRSRCRSLATPVPRQRETPVPQSSPPRNHLHATPSWLQGQQPLLPSNLIAVRLEAVTPEWHACLDAFMDVCSLPSMLTISSWGRHQSPTPGGDSATRGRIRQVAGSTPSSVSRQTSTTTMALPPNGIYLPDPCPLQDAGLLCRHNPPPPSAPEESPLFPLADATLYRGAAGSLIASPLPLKPTWTRVKRIFRHLKGTRLLVLWFPSPVEGGLLGYLTPGGQPTRPLVSRAPRNKGGFLATLARHACSPQGSDDDLQGQPAVHRSGKQPCQSQQLLAHRHPASLRSRDGGRRGRLSASDDSSLRQFVIPIRWNVTSDVICIDSSLILGVTFPNFIPLCLPSSIPNPGCKALLASPPPVEDAQLGVSSLPSCRAATRASPGGIGQVTLIVDEPPGRSIAQQSWGREGKGIEERIKAGCPTAVASNDRGRALVSRAGRQADATTEMATCSETRERDASLTLLDRKLAFSLEVSPQHAAKALPNDTASRRDGPLILERCGLWKSLFLVNLLQSPYLGVRLQCPTHALWKSRTKGEASLTLPSPAFRHQAVKVVPTSIATRSASDPNSPASKPTHTAASPTPKTQSPPAPGASATTAAPGPPSSAPRTGNCGRCSNPITAAGVRALGKAFHVGCFACSACAKGLAGARFFEKNLAVFCEDCFGERFCERCGYCEERIFGVGL
ncbi:hypothetical protein BDK51DRAFT_42414 [Blyttiomyces helicus]|uniref:LIM zinc-binding domain-containing protein n=1 Tax=Blyttiomyces helicus TaxID=388810 RepID=A0A4P9W9Y7_9FUNG|nr:hypothetical protein BDK51DRAFT_42414 [Blyttiomyces helicus]|eukprot:RKO89381.1 hypothetical protein BDK51DRAFT_42414 [Blyttiomyces helicus]